MSASVVARKPVVAAAPSWPGSEPMQLALDSYWLWAESCMVIGMRTAAIMTMRPGSNREAVRMVTEKLDATAELAVKLVGAGDNALAISVAHYGKRVTANRKRLERKGMVVA